LEKVIFLTADLHQVRPSDIIIRQLMQTTSLCSGYPR